MAVCLLFGLLTFTKWISATGIGGNFLAYDCYGNVLSLSCDSGHRIKVIDDFFGYSSRPFGENQCRYERGDCTVTNGRFTSVIHRYCEGKQTCSNFQVDRRSCGINQTNYEQVEYQCIPDSDVTSFCESASYSATEGYLSTPNFPSEYPANQHCHCSLTASRPDLRIRLEATHFIVKFDHPCKDWLQVEVGSHRRRLCGAYRSTLRSQAFNLTFHSDQSHGHQGIWLHFTVHPRDGNATVKVDCSHLRWPTTTTSEPEVTTTQYVTSDADMPTTTPPTSDPHSPPDFTSSRSTSRMLPIGENELSPSVTSVTHFKWSDPDETLGNTQADFSERPPPPKDMFKASMSLSPSSSSSFSSYSSTTDSMTASISPPSSTWGRSGRPGHSVYTSYGQGEPPVVRAISPPTLPPLSSSTSTRQTVFLSTLLSGSSSAEGSDRKRVTPPSDRTAADMRKVAETKNAIRRKNNRITGIIIISICVGGIVLLIVILSILLCINKRKQPKRQAERERKKRLQQRLNSLSFYDSIPLYDSIGRKAGAAVGEQTNPAPAKQAVSPSSGADGGDETPSPAPGDGGQILDPKRLTSTPVKPGAPPGGATGAPSTWRAAVNAPPPPPPPPPETAPDIYSEIEKTTDAKTPNVASRSLPNGEGPPGYSLHLAAVDKHEDIYTHV